mmetsp:Transcript_66519/g.97322  ORF Transcript_66519/g.97322 Transcript_66519/m.97322 type:complete len:120 (-) Transcript_66519:1005-1364(-)
MVNMRGLGATMQATAEPCGPATWGRSASGWVSMAAPVAHLFVLASAARWRAACDIVFKIRFFVDLRSRSQVDFCTFSPFFPERKQIDLQVSPELVNVARGGVRSEASRRFSPVAAVIQG